MQYPQCGAQLTRLPPLTLYFYLPLGQSTITSLSTGYRLWYARPRFRGNHLHYSRHVGS